MSPGDPTQRLPCDDALAGLRALRAEVVESHTSWLSNIDRRIASLESCREHCRVSNPATTESGG